VEKAPAQTVKLPLHPDDSKRGFRRFQTNGVFYIKDSIMILKTYRLIGLFNFRNKKFLSKEYDEKLNASLIHWVPANDNLKAEVIMPDNTVKKGLIESNAAKIRVNEVVQLYRFGFCRLDSKEGNKMVFYYGHN
jgi:glutamyl-tRNA synthetase